MESSLPFIGARLKAFRQRTKTKMPVVAGETGISKETLYKWEQGTKPSNIEDYVTLKSYLDKMENRLAEDEFLLQSSRPATLRLPLDPEQMATVQTSGKDAAGTILVTENGPELIVDRISAPCLGGIEGLVEVTSDCMEPELKIGSRIGIMRLKDPDLLHWGERYYIIDKNFYATVKRIYRGDSPSTLTLVSDNPDKQKYPPVIISRYKIIAILKVTGIFQKC